jgi:TRAP-type C4-dicarboxylate transport system substrate-binding protein
MRIFALVAGWALALSAAAQNPMVLKVTTLDRENDVLSEPLIWWMKTVAERTNNRVTFQPFWSQSLVPVTRTMSAVKSGIADAGYFVTALLSSEERDFAVLELDGALPTDERYVDAWKAIEPTITKILERNGAVMMYPRRSPKVSIACKTKHLTQASDYKGMKIRAAGRWESAGITRWGAAAFAIPPAETYTALQRGTVDCTYHIYTILWAFKLYEVAPYITRLDNSSSFNFIGMSREKWNQISEADRRAIGEVSAQAMRREMDALKVREETIIVDMEKAGAKFHTPSPAEKKRLHDAIKPLWQEVRKVMGPDGVKLADILEPMQK